MCLVPRGISFKILGIRSSLLSPLVFDPFVFTIACWLKNSMLRFTMEMWVSKR